MSNTIYGKKGWTPDLMKSQKGKTFLITGATSGTGFEAAKILASIVIIILVLNIILFAMRITNVLVFWIIIILAAITAWFGIPQLRK